MVVTYPLAHMLSLFTGSTLNLKIFILMFSERPRKEITSLLCPLLLVISTYRMKDVNSYLHQWWSCHSIVYTNGLQNGLDELKKQ